MNEKLEKLKIQFGRRVKAARTEKKLTQLDLAAQAFVDVRQIKRIENGEVATSIITAYLISKALGKPIGEFFEPEDE